MKKFLVKLCIFIFILSATILLLSWLYTPIKYQDYDTEKFRDMPERIQICNFGSSHGQMGFNYEKISNKFSCFNFGLSGQTLMYDYRILQHYINHIDEGGIVFIVISYFSFFGRPETVSANFIAWNNRYYTILPSRLIKNYDFITECIVNYFSVMTFEMGIILNSILEIGGDMNTADELNDIKKAGEKKAADHFKWIKDKDGTIMFSRERTEALHNIIALCREKKLIPILVTTPYLTEYSEPFKRDSKFIQEFKSVLQDVIASENVRYYDYSEDERFSHDYTLFRDTEHLNRNGALKFTQILIEDVMRDLNQ